MERAPAIAGRELSHEPQRASKKVSKRLVDICKAFQVEASTLQSARLPIARHNEMSVTSVPAFVCSYGPSGLGKTTDHLYAMPRGFFIGTPGAFKPSEHVVGFTLANTQVFEADRISTVTAMLPKLGKEFDGVCIDDFSLLAERTLRLLEKTKKGFEIWTGLSAEVLQFRDAARAYGKHVIVNCHEQGPQTKSNGKYVRGGPKLPSQLPEDFPTQCDMVLRAVHEPTRTGAWKVAYRCGVNDPAYVMKDRHDVTPPVSPMNLGELLRAAKYPIRRAPGLEWMEDVVERIAQAAATTEVAKHGELAKAIIASIQQNNSKNTLHIRWALRDGFDRWTIRKWQNDKLDAFTNPGGNVPFTL